MQPSPQVPRIPPDSLSPALRAAYDRAVETRGDGTFLQVTAHAPELVGW